MKPTVASEEGGWLIERSGRLLRCAWAVVVVRCGVGGKLVEIAQNFGGEIAQNLVLIPLCTVTLELPSHFQGIYF